jgi:microcystin-dependent protein
VASVWTEVKNGRQLFPYYYDSSFSNKLVSMNTAALAPAPVGGGQAHNNIAPYLAVSFIIALSGVFPTRS